jgi:type III pantothenate kinase
LPAIAVDIGNSGLRAVPIPSNDRLLDEPIRINWHASSESANQHASNAWTGQLDHLLTENPGAVWWISSVNRPATEHLTQFLSEKGAQYRLLDYRQLPVEVEVDFPERVGIDRLLAAIAAGHFSTTDRFVVVQAGSAVTVDLVARVTGVETPGESAKLRFLGGAILPGVPMMLRLLGRAADMLPELHAADLVNLPDLPGKNTEAAMIAGCSSCLVGGVQHLIHRYQATGKVQSIIVSGGDGPLLAPYLDTPVTVVPHLVLQGVAQVARLS